MNYKTLISAVTNRLTSLIFVINELKRRGRKREKERMRERKGDRTRQKSRERNTNNVLDL